MNAYPCIEEFYGGVKNLLPHTNTGDLCVILFRRIDPDAPGWAREPDAVAGTVYSNVRGHYCKITTLNPDQRHPYGDVI